MKILLSCCFLGMTLFSLAQTTIETKNLKWTFKAGYAAGTSLTRQNEIVFFLCFEGCSPIRQRLRTVQTADLSLSYNLNENHKLGVGLNAMHHYFEQSILFNFIGPIEEPSDYPMEYVYAGLCIFHEWDFYKDGSLELFLNNGIRYNQFLDEGKGYPLKEKTLDYQVFVGLRKMFFNTIGLELGPYLNTALTPYNERKYNKNFYPYHFGINLNLIGRF